MARRRTPRSKATAGSRPSESKVCGLCGKGGALVRTECCNQWICDDEAEYRLFSYARNSCARNHRRLTLCGYHFAEQHEGRWQDCGECREGFETEIYVWYGTNEYNFAKLERPPAFRPTFCPGCHRRIRLGTDGYILDRGKYWCEACGSRRLRLARPQGRRGKGDA